jgi:hypothetical protein
MSNRTIEQANAMAELRTSHLAQIAALIGPGTESERLERFLDACNADAIQRVFARTVWMTSRGSVYSAAKVAWLFGDNQRSIFAFLPGHGWGCCGCPVQMRMAGVPHYIPQDWQPSVQQLERFSTIQIAERFNK